VWLSNLTAAGNSAPQGSAGALSAASISSLYLTGGAWTGNSAGQSGGAVAVAITACLAVASSVMSGNTAGAAGTQLSGVLGGAMHVAAGPAPSLGTALCPAVAAAVAAQPAAGCSVGSLCSLASAATQVLLHNITANNNQAAGSGGALSLATPAAAGTGALCAKLLACLITGYLVAVD
jgi:hypothetical protein